jgi:DNA-binding CsgD family transcriptional regulator
MKREDGTLTQCQKYVLQLISNGVPTESIATAMKVEINTVNWHRMNIIKNLKAQSMPHAVALALREGAIK